MIHTRSLALIALIALVACGQPASRDAPQPVEVPAPEAAPESTEAALEAFGTVYAVLTHPRCLNCHPTGDSPLQYDDSRPHVMTVQRGEEGGGHPAMRCAGCHDKVNGPWPNHPPGVSSEWRLAPRSMAFEGKSPRELAAGLKGQRMTLTEMTEHVEHDPLVLWGWSPGPGRTPVATPHEAFVTAFKAWVQAGAPIPAAEEGR